MTMVTTVATVGCALRASNKEDACWLKASAAAVGGVVDADGWTASDE